MIKTKLKFNDPAYMMRQVKRCEYPNEMKETLQQIFANPYFKQYLSQIYFPKRIDKIKKTICYLPKGDFEKEMLWVSSILDINYKIINNFIDIEDKYDFYLLTGDYDNAIKIIDLIEKEYGISCWSLEQKINLCELKYGTDAQRDFTSAITRNENISAGVRLLLLYYGWRAEKNMSFRLYNYSFRRLCEEDEEHFWLKANYYGSSTFKDLASILDRDENSSLIDIYQTFLKICQYVFTSNDPELLNTLKKSLQYTKRINDIRLSNLRTLLLHDFSEIIVNTAALQILDSYTIGKYEEVVFSIVKAFNQGDLQADYPEILVRACIKGELAVPYIGDNLLAKIVSNMQVILLKGERYGEAVEELQKIVSTYQSQKWTARINSFLLEEQFSKAINKIKVGFINTFSGNPRQGYYILPDKRQAFFERLEIAFPLSPSVRLQSIMVDYDTSIDELDKLELPAERKNRYLAKLYCRIGEIEKAKETYEQLICNSDPISTHDAIIGLLNCLTDLKEYPEAIKLIAECAIKNTNNLVGLPVKRVLNEIEGIGRHNLWQDINLSISYHAYSKLFGADKDGIMAVACEKFLRAHGYKRPSEIDPNNISKEALIYYLRKVCAIPILDASCEYAGSDEVEKERILVCQSLSLLDTKNAERYSSEIKAITQRIAIKQNIRKIEDSKIYVDTEGIKACLSKMLGESFERFMSLEGHNLDNFVIELKRVIPDMKFRIFNDEKYELFRSMFLEFRNHFTATEYGLENCLSTGIRHGVLAASLRKPLEVTNLITVKDASTGQYLENEYWKEKLAALGGEELNLVIKSLSNFSKDADQLIELLRTKWIQIRTEERNDEGLFDFQFNKEEVKKLQKECEEATSFEEYSELMLSYFWDLTNKALVNIRQRIDLDLKRQFNNIFDSLQRDISCIVNLNKNTLNELFGSIAKARTDMQYELHRIANWFERSSESKIADYEIELPISIGIEIINNIHPTRRIEPVVTIDSKLQLKGNTLRSVVDVIYILLENAIKHSYLAREELELSIKCQEEDDYVELTIVNNVSEEVKKSTNLDSLDALKITINNGNSLEKARSEGGSGYFKIAKIMKYDLKCPYYIDFGFTDKPSFWVKVNINIREVLA